jgi:hypothetical protein
MLTRLNLLFRGTCRGFNSALRLGRMAVTDVPSRRRRENVELSLDQLEKVVNRPALRGPVCVSHAMGIDGAPCRPALPWLLPSPGACSRRTPRDPAQPMLAWEEDGIDQQAWRQVAANYLRSLACFGSQAWAKTELRLERGETLAVKLSFSKVWVSR